MEIFIWFGLGIISSIVWILMCVQENKITVKDTLVTIFLFVLGPISLVSTLVVFVSIFLNFILHKLKLNLDKTLWTKKEKK